MALCGREQRKEDFMPTEPPTNVLPPPLHDLGELTVPAGYMPLRKARAAGLQIYPWDAETRTFGPAHPDAILVTNQMEIINHYRGPTWQAADGSLITGTVVHAVTPDPDAIPWLLLAARPGGDGYGLLSNVSFVQRLFTRRGKAPSSGPAENAEIPVFYKAEYYFYVPQE
jgi:Protein of unknown function (DUF3455)